MAILSKTVVWVTTQFEGIHCWPEAPEEVRYLKHPHRHIFHVKIGVTVSHANREIEFILLKKRVNEYITQMNLAGPHTLSCEMMATMLFQEFQADFVEVSEDGENGARVEKVAKV